MTHRSESGPFTIIPEWVLDAPISDRAVRLYGVLRRYADDVGKCWPSRAALADRLTCSADSIDRALAELDDLGAIRRQPRADDRGQTSNLYWIKVSAPTRPPLGTGAEGPLGTGAARNESHDERENLGLSLRTRAKGPVDNSTLIDTPNDQPQPPDSSSVAALVDGYVEDYRITHRGRAPISAWTKAAGQQAKRLLGEGIEPDVLARCLGVCATEGKHPGAVANVVDDYFAGKPRWQHR